jgi:FAD/FMN-containing dehydrogenase/Fe-S oxidoreductase
LSDLRFDRLSRVLYSNDASNYQLEPLGVACPRDADEVAAAVSVCAALGLPITARAGGSSLAGQALGEGLILDTARHLHALEIDVAARRAKVGPGLVLDRLNRAAGAHGLIFGPDPASADRACLGGIVANNSTGAHSQVYGMAADHVRAADVVLADGSRARLEPRSAEQLRGILAGDGLEARINAQLIRMVDEDAETIVRDFPRYWRRAGGYALDRLIASARGLDVLPESLRSPAWRQPLGLDPCQILAGSEGTLAIATSLELDLVPIPPHRGLLVAQFDAPLDPYPAVPALLATDPSAIELVDHMLLRLARGAPGYAADLAFIQGDPAALLIIEQSAESASELKSRLAASRLALERAGFRGPFDLALRPADQARVWRARKAGLGILARRRGDMKPVAGIEDTAVPPQALADYMAEVQSLLAEQRVEAAFYAHASAGCIHVRPVLNLKTTGGRRQLGQLCEAVFDLAMKHGGVNASEHGDGLARTGFNRRLFGPAVYSLFEDLKASFDPAGILNPGKVVGPPAPLTALRYGPAYAPTIPASRFAYPEDGDISRAIEQCNGAAVCRKLDTGSMCPSFMATGEERDSTRGRANALRAAMDGRLPLLGADALAAPALAQAMDLCLGCKACKTECPSGVDMARLKIEVDAAQGAARGFGPRAQLLARVHALDSALCRVPAVANAVLTSSLARWAGRFLGIHPSRSFPALAEQDFERWWRARERRGTQSTGAAHEVPIGQSRAMEGARPPIVLFPDTFTRFHEPQIGRAVAQLAEAAGHRVVVPPGLGCCGRPALSQGMVDLALRQARANLAILAPLAAQGLTILVPEPSCASAFRDDLPDLLGLLTDDAAAARQIAASVTTVEEWVAALPVDALTFKAGPSRALVHVHCHQRALVGTGPTLDALGRIPGLETVEPDAGCCGMAGSFGYAREHQEVSRAIAEGKLGPALRAAERSGDTLITSGASCRQQMRDLWGREAQHPAVLLAGRLDGDG